MEFFDYRTDPFNNSFYGNQRDGTLLKLTPDEVGPWLSERAEWVLASWVDYDDDGWVDLFLPAGAKTRLYRNRGDGGLDNITPPIACDTGAWADYDNDGRLDLFGAKMGTGTNVLYHNEGEGTFRTMTATEVGSVSGDRATAGGAAWGDYDNDGWLDLCVANGWWAQSGAGQEQCFFYRNNGDGTFTRVASGSPANELGKSLGADWVDYDRNGFLDLFVLEYGIALNAPHRLYHNNGNSNSWLVVRCMGTLSPRFATGAKVRAKAVIGGQARWQLRLIDAGGTAWGGQSFEAHFGLGDATKVDTLRIEWPSGIVQELKDVDPNQILTVTEPPRLIPQGAGAFQIRCWVNQAFDVQASTDLATWSSVTTVTNLTRTLVFEDFEADQHESRYYRVVAE